MTQDITYTLGGVLKTAALQAGLHQPDVFAHFSRSRYNLNPDELREAVSVWCCIYVTIERYEFRSLTPYPVLTLPAIFPSLHC